MKITCGDEQGMKNEVQIAVKVDISIDEKNAKGFLWLVERYINQNNMKVVSQKTESGETELFYESV